MPGVEGKQPTSEEIKQVRERSLAKLEEKGLNNFYPADIKRLRTNDHYVTRCWLHVFDLPGGQADEAVSLVIKCFTWRKQFGVEEITEKTVKRELLEKGSMFTRNRDKDGKKLVVLWLKNHLKGEFPMDESKRMLVYFMERLEREEKGEKISWVFDCKGAGLRNMDIEYVQFLIEAMEHYYPDLLSFIYIFELPWLLNAGFKVVKAMLPAAGVAKLRDVDKKTFPKFVDDDNRLECWGGSDDWEFEFEPEVVAKEVAKVTQEVEVHTNGLDMSSSSEESQVDTRPRPGRSLPPTPSDRESTYSQLSRADSVPQSVGSDLLKVRPAHMVLFGEGGRASLTLTNITDRVVAFKVKTTSPDKFRVKPSTAAVRPGETITIEMGAGKSGKQLEGESLAREKFLVSAIKLQAGQEFGHQAIHSALKRVPPEAQYRLMCGVGKSEGGPINSSSKTSAVSSPPSSSSSVEIKAEATKMMKKLATVLDNQEKMEGQITILTYGLGGLLGLVFLLLILLLFFNSCPPPVIMDSCDATLAHTETVKSSGVGSCTFTNVHMLIFWCFICRFFIQM